MLVKGCDLRPLHAHTLWRPCPRVYKLTSTVCQLCAGALVRDNAELMHFTAKYDGNGLTRALLAHLLDADTTLAVRLAAAAALGDMLPKLPMIGVEALDNASPLPQARSPRTPVACLNDASGFSKCFDDHESRAEDPTMNRLVRLSAMTRQWRKLQPQQR